MNESLLLTLWLLPLLLVPLALRANGGIWPILAPLPALIAGLILPNGAQLEIPWLLLGTQLAFNDEARAFLLVASLLWLAAAYYAHEWMTADGAAQRFRACFLLAMSGNFGVIVSADLISFYLSFSAMGLAAYGLVVHGGKPSQRRAGRVYLIMTLIGEMALFAAFVLIYQRTDTLTPDTAQLVGARSWETGLLILAFAIKAGVLGVHFWLPLAHPAAPVPASAVLSGAMIKTALIGWLRYLPLGEQAMPEWGAILVVTGSSATLFAFVCGMLQSNPKVLLAYSSISKMGLMVATLGLALLEPTLADTLIAAMVIFAAHHGLAKGALFLGVGLIKTSVWRHSPVLLLLPALALAGAPLTSGGFAKTQLNTPLSQLPGLWADIVASALVVAAIATPLMMARFLYLLKRIEREAIIRPATQWWPWLALVAILLAIPLIKGSPAGSLTSPSGLLIAMLFAGLVWWRRPTILACWVDRIPPGDILALFNWFCQITDQTKWMAFKPAQCVGEWVKQAKTQPRLADLRQANSKQSTAGMTFGPLWLGVTTGLLMLTLWS